MIVSERRTITLECTVEEATLIRDALEVIDPDDGGDTVDRMVTVLSYAIGAQP